MNACQPSDSLSRDSLAFDVEGWHCIQLSDETIRCWETPDGDRIGVSLNWGAEAFPPGMRSLTDLREHWDSRLRSMQGSVVEIAVHALTGGPVYAIVHKRQQDPLGFSCTATILVPFEGFGFMIVVRCDEKGMTGLREAIAFDRKVQSLRPTVEEAQPAAASIDPDHEVSDDEMPEHPLSRLHRLLERILRSLTIASPVRALPRPDPLPPA